MGDIIKEGTLIGYGTYELDYSSSKLPVDMVYGLNQFKGFKYKTGYGKITVCIDVEAKKLYIYKLDKETVENMNYMITGIDYFGFTSLVEANTLFMYLGATVVRGNIQVNYERPRDYDGLETISEMWDRVKAEVGAEANTEETEVESDDTVYDNLDYVYEVEKQEKEMIALYNSKVDHKICSREAKLHNMIERGCALC